MFHWFLSGTSYIIHIVSSNVSLLFAITIIDMCKQSGTLCIDSLHQFSFIQALLCTYHFVGFFTADNDISKQFKKLADALNVDHRFAHTTNKDTLEKYKYSK